MAKEYTNEQIVAAMLANGTVKGTAATLGITERTIYNRMTDGEFQEIYKAARADILRLAVNRINDKLTIAIDTVSEVMENTEVNPATRLQAAQTIINTAAKLADRLTAQEQTAINQAESNIYGGIF